MKKPIYILVLSTLAIFTMSCDEETLAKLTAAASSFLEKTPGCMNANNTNYNPVADEHVQDSCAVQIYGCTDATALNYNISATNMCAGITTDQCCTSTFSGCTNENYDNYNENANDDDGSCAGEITFGCMVQGNCNYNPNATSDCSQVAGGSNANCCEASDTTSVVCVIDFDNDGFQDENTNSQTLTSGNCGCSTLGYGWTNSDNINGEAIWGCLDPTCPEYNPEANINDGNCCLAFSALDSLFMFGEDFADCAADTDGDGIPNAENCIETGNFSLLGGYLLDDSDCAPDDQQTQDSDDHYEEMFIFLGYDGDYYQEWLSIQKIDGYRAPPIYLPTYDSPADCETYAAGSNWYCGNQMADAETYRPCQEEYFQGWCEQRGECWWEAPECRWNTSQWVGDACWDDANMSNQSACTADPGCQWNQQWHDCYFDCWGLSETNCAEHVNTAGATVGNSALNDECQWKEPDANDGFCSASANNHAQCNAQGASAGECSDPTYSTKQTCENAGTCSNPAYNSEQACNNGGSCSIAGITSENACWNSGTCSNPAYTSEQACYNAGSCSDPSITQENACWNSGSCSDPSITQENACWNSDAQWHYNDWTWETNYWYNASWQWAWWQHAGNWWYEGESACNGWDQWNDNTNQWAFVCECYADTEAECETDAAGASTGYTWETFGSAQCEFKPYSDGCGELTNPGACNSAASTNNCQWDFQGGYCFKEQGVDCWMLNSEGQCGSNADCSWWTPPGYNAANVPEEFQDVAVPGVCNFYDWCHDYYCYDGDCDQQGCNDDSYCRWEEIPGQPKNCTEDTQAQYCECYVEWSPSSCTQAGLTWDNMHNECMHSMDENACYNIDDLMLGPADGNIDCGAFVSDNANHYTEWIPGLNVCEDIFEESTEGTYTIDGNQLCHESEGDFEEDDCGNLYFEECQCNLHRCNWTPMPTFNNPDAGTCDEGSVPRTGNGRTKVEGHYKIKTVSTRFQDEQIHNFIYSNSSLNPEEKCLTFTLQDNGSIHLIDENESGGSCTIILNPVGPDF